MTAAADSDRLGLFSACLPGWDARRVIEVAVSLGFGTVEWGSGPGQAIADPRRGEELRSMCEDAGVHSGGVLVQDPEVTFATPRTAARYVALAITLGAPRVRVFAPPYRGGSLEREQRKAQAGIDALVELAAPSGVTVLIETSPSTLAPGPELAAVLVERHPPERAGVLYDPGNTAIEGYLSPALTIARLGRHLRHVHVKNISWSRRDGAWRWRHAPLADGMIDWRALLERLALERYDGDFAIDHLGGKATAGRLRSETELLRALIGCAFSEVPTPRRKGGSRSQVAL